MLNIGIIGHVDNINRIQKVIKKRFESINGIPIVIHEMNQLDLTIEYIRTHMNELDGIIFTGKVLYNLLNHNMHSTIPWVYLENDDSMIQRALITIGQRLQENILKISVDAYSHKEVKEIYKDFGFEEDEYQAYIADINLLSKHLFHDLVVFHKKNYLTYGTFPITSISTVREMLVDQNIPCILLTPNEKSIINQLNLLLEKIKVEAMVTSQIVVISIEIDMMRDFQLQSENEYAIMMQKTRITDEVYKFAQSIQAAVVESEKSYLLFTTKKILEYETHNLNELSILNIVNDRSEQTISVGIGFGVTAREAKFNAITGKNKSIKMGGNHCFVVYDKSNMEAIKPIQHDASSSKVFDFELQKIADTSGVSINNIYQLKSLMELYKKDTFTSQELSKEFKNSLRSMNRIVEKLELAGYIEVVGKRIIGKAGRPSRLLKLLI